MMKDQGVKFSPENGQSAENASTWVVSFPVKAPKNSVFVKDLSAIDQLKWYLRLQKHWSEHNASCTIYVGEDEWAEVGSFVYDHLNEIIAVSFLPRDNGSYQQAPEEEITEAQYKKMIDEFPTIDYSNLSKYEKEDQTTGAQTLACTSGVCELP
jgi:ribonucleoside-diphosphate reductase alpha chain